MCTIQRVKILIQPDGKKLFIRGDTAHNGWPQFPIVVPGVKGPGWATKSFPTSQRSCRKSTCQEDQAYSLQSQWRYFQVYINTQLSWPLAVIYADEGALGTSVLR